MKRKNDKLELILLGVGILLLLLLFVVKRRLDAPEETATAESRTETMEGKKQEETIQNMEQENAAFLNSKKEEQKETTAAGPVQIRVLLTDCGKLGYAQKQVSLRGNASLSMNDGAYIASPQETICVTEQECGEVVHVVPADETAGTAVSLTGKPEDETVYPGSFVIYKSEEGLLVVNELDLEMYLRYVVPSEMPSSYEKEALKAQAVCARTYACARIREKTWENYHADVDDSVESQVYHNMEAQPETDAAVAETEGKIITCGGEPIQAYFFSTSCGKTSTDEVWNTAETAEYLKSVTVGGEKQEPETEEAFASFITKRDSTSLEVEDGWYRWQDILRLARLVVTSRNVGDDPLLHEKAKQLDATGARILFAPVEALPMASSALRARLAAGERCENELPPLVRRVIQREGLYRETKGDEDRNDSETGKRACAQPPERSAL